MDSGAHGIFDTVRHEYELGEETEIFFMQRLNLSLTANSNLSTSIQSMLTLQFHSAGYFSQ
jgi:hypothetical protein